MKTNFSIHAFWIFCRPHAMLGTLLQAIVIYSLAKSSTDNIDTTVATLSLLSIILLHIYGMGINQIYDLEIDRINKPSLPLVSGKISIKQAKIITYTSGILSLFLAMSSTSYLFITICFLLFFTTSYSVPPMRFKENATLAALSISISRSFIYVGGLLLTLTDGSIIDRPNHLSLVFLIFSFFYALVISFTKDIPDVQGDQKYGVKSLAVLYGIENITYVGLTILSSLFLVLSIYPFIIAESQGWVYFFSASQVILLAFLAYGYWKNCKAHMNHKKYYAFLWGLLYLQYIVFFVASL